MENQSMQDAINANLKPVETPKTVKISQDVYQELKHLASILDAIKSLESQIETLSNNFDEIEKRVIKSLFSSGMDDLDPPILVDDIIVVMEYCDGYSLGIQRVLKPEIEC